MEAEPINQSGNHHQMDHEGYSIDTQQVTTTTAGGAAQGSSSPLDTVRSTPEYRAAWDVEVWRLMQQRKLEKELKDQHKKAVELMKQGVAQRDKEAQSLIDRRLKEVDEELRKVSAETISQEQRKRRLVESERELKRQKQDLIESHKKLEIDADEKIQRVKGEAAHRLVLEAERFKGMESINSRLEERLSDSQKEYQKLWQEFADFKAAQLGGGGLHGGGGVAALHWKGQMETLKAHHASEIVAMSERNERRMHESLLTHEKKLEDFHRSNRKTSSSLTARKEQLKVVSQDLMLEKEKSRDLAKELAMVRQQLLESKAQVAAAVVPLGQQQLNIAGCSKRNHHHNQERCQKSSAAAPPAASSAASTLKESVLRVDAAGQEWQQHQQPNRGSGSGSAVVTPTTEVEKDLHLSISRWEKEKAMLLENTGGAYSEQSTIIQDLTRRILAARSTVQQLLS